MEYDTFTDIEFNPAKSINCQAMAAAVYVSLRKEDFLAKALESTEDFVEVVYGIRKANDEVEEQLNLFDNNDKVDYHCGSKYNK